MAVGKIMQNDPKNNKDDASLPQAASIKFCSDAIEAVFIEEPIICFTIPYALHEVETITVKSLVVSI